MSIYRALPLFLSLGLLSFFALAEEDYRWSNVAIGAGGFVSAVTPSTAEEGLIYARTDVGGAYRWEADEQRWIALTDWVSDEQTGYLGIESLALDPNNADRLYMLAGISYFNNGRTAILRSDDRGESFDVIEVTDQFRAHGNGMGRQNGERLQVDPNNGDVLYVGTRTRGLFKSEDRGTTWTHLDALNVSVTPNENGISFVLLDPKSIANGKSQTLYVGVSRFGSVGPNLYVSHDAGESFTAVANAPGTVMPQRAVLADNGYLFITYGDGAGPHGHWDANLNEPMESGGVWKLQTSTGNWTDISPGIQRAYGGISVDPNNPQRLLTSTINTYLEQYPGAWGDRLFLSEDGGNSWVDLVARGFELDNNGVSWVDGHAIHWAGSIEFDPFNSNRAWVTSGNGIFNAENLSAQTVSWVFKVRGFEETVPLGLASIADGPVVSVIGDYDGFVHSDVSQYAPIHNPQMGTTTDLAVAAGNTDILVRVGNRLYFSTNRGLSWTEITNTRGSQGNIALSADGGVLLHRPRDSSTTYRSTDWGNSWTSVSGLNSNSARPLADPVNANRFYAYVDASLKVSTDGGATFSNAGSLPTGGSSLIRATPTCEGDLWVALRANGLARSTDGGASFTTFGSVASADAVGFGKAAAGTDYPTVYIWGTVEGVRGVHRSIDKGESWVRVNDDQHQYGGPGNGQFVVGDNNYFGRVYMSTAGRGIVYGEPETSNDSNPGSSDGGAYDCPTPSATDDEDSEDDTNNDNGDSEPDSPAPIPDSGSASSGGGGSVGLGLMLLLLLAWWLTANRLRGQDR